MEPILAVLLALGGMLAGFIVGALAGMDLFGNYFVRATFFKSTGYEAGFWYGGIAGGFAGLLLGLLAYRVVSRRLAARHKKQ